MKVSVVTVSLDSADTIEPCIQSVIGQTHADIEHISVDGGSADGTLDIIENYRDHFAARLSQKDGGVYQAMNRGLALAGGGLVGFLNSDDVYAADDILARVVEALEAENLDSCYGDLVYVDPGDSGRTVRYWKAGPYRAEKFEKGWMPPIPPFLPAGRFMNGTADSASTFRSWPTTKSCSASSISTGSRPATSPG
jgi:glycosyltransferase involved in cell wall biosynthesis